MKLLTQIAGFFHPGRPVSMAIFGWIALAVTLIDQLTKWVAVAWFNPTVRQVEFQNAAGALERTYAVLRADDPVVLIPGLLQFQFRINTGAAFSFMEGRTGFLTLVSILIGIIVLVWAWRLPRNERGLRLSLGLIFGGAVGNLIDRVWLGYVVDFIDAHWFETYHWPTFNIADSAICVGIFLFVIATFFVAHPASEPAAPAPAAPARKRPEAS